MSIRRRLAEEEGMALMAALGVAVIVTLLTVVAVSISFHDLTESATNRERVQSIAAAEAGLNRMFAHLETATPATVQCSISEQLAASPDSSFTVTLYEEVGGSLQPLTCPAASLPEFVTARSVGHAIGNIPTRTMEAKIRLDPVHSSVFGPDAIFSDADLTLNSNIQVEGDEGNNANVYSNGTNILLSNIVVAGTVYGQNEIVLSSNSEVKKDVWAKNRVELNSNAIGRRNVTSSTSTVSVLTQAHVYGDARAGTTITAADGSIDGLRIDNSPSGPPPLKPFPAFTYNPADWQALGYTTNAFGDCTSARNFINGIPSSDHTKKVVRITTVCDLTWGSNSVINLHGDLAIITNGAVKLSSNARFSNPSAAPADRRNLHLIAGLGSCSGTSGNIEFSSNSSVGSNLTTLIYTPCTANLNSNSFLLDGQVVGGSVQFNSNTRITFKPVVGPETVIVGYTVEPQYRREIRND